MNGNHEIRWFFNTLLKHKCRSTPENCPACLLLEKIYGLTLQVIFSTVLYPEIQIGARRQASSAKAAAVGHKTGREQDSRAR
jgi:hypothetical protein